MKEMKAYIKMSNQNVAQEELEKLKEIVKDIPGAIIKVEGSKKC